MQLRNSLFTLGRPFGQDLTHMGTALADLFLLVNKLYHCEVGY